jgi:hypothetical protein
MRSSATISFLRITLLLIHNPFQYLVSFSGGLQESRVTDSSTFFRLAVGMHTARRGHQLANGKVCCNLRTLLRSQTHFINPHEQLLKLFLYTF